MGMQINLQFEKNIYINIYTMFGVQGWGTEINIVFQ